MNYFGIKVENVEKYNCVHCMEWISVEEYKRHSLTHHKDTTLPTPDSMQEYIDRFLNIGLASPSDFMLK